MQRGWLEALAVLKATIRAHCGLELMSGNSYIQA